MTDFYDLSSQLSSSLEPVATPRVLTIAGSDCSGGAGVEADLKTITAHKCYGLTCISALTAQNSLGVHNVTETPAETVEKVLVALADDQLRLDAIKLGLLTEQTLSVVEPFLAARAGEAAIVLDPVFAAKNGDRLSSVGALKKTVELFKHARVITPNSREVEILLAVLQSSDPSVARVDLFEAEDIYKAARVLGSKLAVDVLVKGGQIPVNGRMVVDLESPRYILNVLYEHKSKKLTVFQSNYVNSPNLHGTGCTLSSAIACHLARGAELATAVKNAVVYTNEAIRHAEVKHNGPLNHVYALAHPAEFNLLQYLISNSKVVPHWNKYVHHEFVEQIHNKTLPLEKFDYFLKQDYVYLKAYHKVHVNLRTITESEELQEYVDGILANIETEMQKHALKLETRFPNIDLETDIVSNQATINYTSYLVDLFEETHDWLQCKTALMPCLIGYNHAAANFAQNGTKFVVADSGHNVHALETARKLQAGKAPLETGNSLEQHYEAWMADYTSPWYLEACKKGEEVLNQYFDAEVEKRSKEPGFDKTKLLQKLAGIFGKVSQLEAEFWDICLAYTE
ncbi:hypothetical protein OGAPHI_005997 [Ogataea philodendri]|uniref:Phosphomethylpyrimidine kinase n=1 Tax=Ogataea philodendri TaxID=1378263 RepID=A0A9P8T141_9ASCO|nr:uncharacterized protein OGAPHI_005997 [Ogataea philodendri]KAH3661819.1 hypothetical protein OGAPHI_005997 [Ogataea philodendri]